MVSWEKIEVAAGTRNPAKIKAIKDAFILLFNRDPIVIERDVDPGVPPQPMGMDEIIYGAVNRARGAFYSVFGKTEVKPSEFFRSASIRVGIGIEAGLVGNPYVDTGYLDFQFTAVYLPWGRILLGCGSGFEYPPAIINPVIRGEVGEVGEIMGKISGDSEIKYKKGAIGYLTGGKIGRDEILKNGVLMALVPLIKWDMYFEHKKSI